jgi:hypothetical protein
MDSSLIQDQELENEEDGMGVPVCRSNLSSTVFDRAIFIAEVHYKILPLNVSCVTISGYSKFKLSSLLLSSSS